MKGLLLDLDDTLVTYGPGGDELWLHLAREAGAADMGTEPLLAAFHKSMRWLWQTPEHHRRTRVDALNGWANVSRLAFEAVGLKLDEPAATKLAAAFLDGLIERLELLPGARETLVEARRRGIRLALVTNGDARFQRRKLARHHLTDYFAALVFEGESGFGKPDPAIYRLALTRLGLTAADAWMAGDNLEFDVAGPQRVGIRAAWVNRGGHATPPGAKPDRVVRSVQELLDGDVCQNPDMGQG